MKPGAILFAALATRALAAVNFSHDIAPIVHQYCSPCHRPGEAGPFPLITYAQVKSHARQIADVTRRHYMPPWLPEPGHSAFPGHGLFKDELRLTADQIQKFADWASTGAPEGSPSTEKFDALAKESWALGQPDLILEAPRAYSLAASGTDIYWNFIFTAKIPATRWVRAIEIRPGDKRLVHHANLYVDRAHSARKQEIAAGAGFGGMDPVIERPVFEPDDGRFLYWKPGGIPYTEPEGFEWRLDPGSDLVLNAHLQPSGKPELVRPSIGLYFTDRHTEKTRRAFPMLVQLEHDGALNIPAGDRDFVVADDFRLPMDAYILAIYPHAHNLGHVLEAYATSPTGRRDWLIRIPEWDRNWESVYRYQEPVFLKQGTVISMRFHYDNSTANVRNPHDPPQRVRAGNRTSDEMGHLWLQVLPADLASISNPLSASASAPRDRRLELQEAVIRHTLEKYPNDASAHLHLGAIQLARMDAQGALAELQTAAQAEPRNPEARNMLGSALAAVGRTTEAIEQFRAAVKLRPEDQNARYNLARALIKARRFDEAVALFQQVVAAYPNDAQARNGLGEVLFQQGNYGAALKEFERAVAIDPQYSVARKNRELAIQAGKSSPKH